MTRLRLDQFVYPSASGGVSLADGGIVVLDGSVTPSLPIGTAAASSPVPGAARLEGSRYHLEYWNGISYSDSAVEGAVVATLATPQNIPAVDVFTPLLVSSVTNVGGTTAVWDNSNQGLSLIMRRARLHMWSTVVASWPWNSSGTWRICWTRLHWKTAGIVMGSWTSVSVRRSSSARSVVRIVLSSSAMWDIPDSWNDVLRLELQNWSNSGNTVTVEQAQLVVWCRARA